MRHTDTTAAALELTAARFREQAAEILGALSGLEGTKKAAEDFMDEHLGAAYGDDVAELAQLKEIVERPWLWYREQQARCPYCKKWYGNVADAQQHKAAARGPARTPHLPPPPQAKQGGGSPTWERATAAATAAASET